MKTAAIILISINLFVSIKDSQSANADEVFTKLATGRDQNDKPIIPKEALERYLNDNGWTSPADLTAETAELLVLEWDHAKRPFISKDKWDAMILTGTWLLKVKKTSADVWRDVADGGILTERLAAYMDKNYWKEFSQGMTAKEAANYIARGSIFITKSEWTATIQIEAFIRRTQ